MADNLQLSTVQPDFEQISNQLSAYLADKASWLSLSKSSTGTLLIEAMAAIGAYDQYTMMAAVRETNLDTAHLPESIYTNCRFLGVRISRKTPAQVTAILQNNDLNQGFIEIPKFTQFDIEGTKYFNREPIIFNSSDYIQNVTLYQGEVKSAQFTSSGSAYQVYKLEEKEKWVISDQDIICYREGQEYERSEDPIYLFGTSDRKFYENSLPDGNVEVKFGNGIYGMFPVAGEVITFKYAVTVGSEGNNTRSELLVKSNDYPSITGETTSNAFNGGDEPTILYYKELGAAAGASNGRGIVRDDFKSLVAKYPGVIDCNVYGQAEIAPLDKDWMNAVGLMLLVDDTFTDQTFKQLISYLKSKSIFGLQFVRFNPEPVNVDINLTLYMLPKSDLTISQQKAVNALKEHTKLRLGSLGRSLYASDIEDVIFSVLPNDIDYIERVSPQIDFVINKNQYINISNLTVNVKYSDRDSQSWVNPLSPYSK